MGLRQILQPRDTDELRALPYVQKELRAQNQFEVSPHPPRVYEVPEKWKVACLYLFTFSFWINLILA